MKCVKVKHPEKFPEDYLTVTRVTDKSADFLVGRGSHVYISKSEYRFAKRKHLQKKSRR